ncbi:hypothetical protein [uncultured Halopseudomonas sp.]|uniref:hypothetical protein n=1 Tax=uncultured Halopseudomonas sp. TaxID=2901193 RepID=UPI0030EF8EA0|tara:strand:- start:8626 stop:8922 length:297 start_codon:yes stop_codon:yes gene_type:complete
MAAALALLFKLFPLYITVGLGWLAGRFLKASGSHIAGIMLCIVTPSVVFPGVMSAPLSASVIMLPFLAVYLRSQRLQGDLSYLHHANRSQYSGYSHAA